MNSKRSLKFGYVDVLLIAFTILVISVLALFLFKDSLNYNYMPKNTSYMSVFISKTDSCYDGLISPGDKVFDTSSGEEIGVIENVVYSNAVEDIYNAETNSFTKASYPDKIDIRMIIKISVKETALTNYKTGGCVSLNVPDYAFTAVIEEVSQVPPVLKAPNISNPDITSIEIEDETENYEVEE